MIDTNATSANPVMNSSLITFTHHITSTTTFTALTSEKDKQRLVLSKEIILLSYNYSSTRMSCQMEQHEVRQSKGLVSFLSPGIVHQSVPSCQVSHTWWPCLMQHAILTGLQTCHWCQSFYRCIYIYKDIHKYAYTSFQSYGLVLP